MLAFSLAQYERERERSCCDKGAWCFVCVWEIKSSTRVLKTILSEKMRRDSFGWFFGVPPHYLKSDSANHLSGPWKTMILVRDLDDTHSPRCGMIFFKNIEVKSHRLNDGRTSTPGERNGHASPELTTTSSPPSFLPSLGQLCSQQPSEDRATSRHY